MKMKKYYNFLSKRLMSIYIIYITLFTLVAYSLCLVYVRNDFKRTEKEYLEGLSASIENHLSYVLDITSTMTNNLAINNFTTATKDTDYINLIQVNDVIRQTNAINNFGSEFAAINYDTGIVVNGNGSMSLSFFETTLGFDKDVLQKKIHDFSKFNKNSIELMSTASESHNKNYLIALISSQTSRNTKPAIFISMYSLDTMFKSIPNSHLPQSIIVSLEKNNVHFTYNSEKEPKISFEENNMGFGCKLIADYTKNAGLWGEINSSVYVSTLHYYIFIHNFFIFLLLFMVALGFVGHLHIKNKTSQIYSPIKKMLHALPKDIENSDDEFETMGKYFSSLESQKNAMSEIISENRIHLKDRFITQLMTSALTKEQIKSQLVTYGLEDVVFPGVTCVVSYKNFDELKNILTMDGIGEVRDAVKECFSKHFADYRYFKIIDIDQQTFAVIICAKDIRNLENQLKKCVLNIEMMLDINMTVFMGSTAESWYDIQSSYTKAASLKDRSRIVTDQSIVVSPRDGMETSTIVYTTEQETELMNYVLSENTNMVSLCLEKLIDENLKNNFLPHEYFSQFVTMLYSTIIKLLNKVNKTEKELYAPKSVYLELMNCDNAAKLKATALNLFGVIISYIEKVRNNSTMDSTEYIVSYVNSRYSEDISLFSLAEYLNMSQSHASKTFKQATGENFKDYLTNIRLTKATEIMDANPYVKISEVAKNVGYSSETFTKAFTKKYNMTPSVYMQRKHG